MDEIRTNGKLAEALAKAQSEITTPKKKNSVSFNGRSYKYADLAEVLDSIRLPLSKNGLALTGIVDLDESKGVTLKTSLMHSSGESITSCYPLPDPSKVKAQEFGSSLTYARRYSISCLLGIASEDDDDGEIAQPAKSLQQKPVYKPKQEPVKKDRDLDDFLNQEHPDDKKPVTKKIALYELVESNSIPTDDVKKYIFQALGNAKSSNDMTDQELDKVISRIKMALKK